MIYDQTDKEREREDVRWIFPASATVGVLSRKSES
jgi:hypothetical protein